MEGNEFLRRMAQGDAKVFDILMPSLRKIALGACHDLRVFDQLKDDIVQDVAMKVYENWQSFQGQSRLSVWIYSIARNRCLDEMRKIKVRGIDDPGGKNPLGGSEHSEDEVKTFIESAQDRSQSIMEQRLCMQQIIAELESHPPARKGSMRTIDMLNFIVENSPSTEELSQFLGTSLSAAKERKSYILKQMRELCLKYCGPDECAFHKMGDYKDDFTIR